MRARELKTGKVFAASIENYDGSMPSIGGLTATVAELNTAADLSAQVAMAPAAGFLGASTVYKCSVTKEGDFIYTRIYIDLTSAKSTTTDRDIIGNTGVAYIGQITAAVNGTIVGGTMECLEVPTTGADDINMYSATAATGAYDADANALAGAALVVDSNGAWALGGVKGMAALPGANHYLYLACGEAGTPGTYDAGKLLITFIGV
jgi:hypothetical protein